MQLFGWDLKSLWTASNQKRCLALLRADRLAEAHEAYRYMIDMGDEATLASCPFEQECSALYCSNGDTALAANSYDMSIQLYSVAIELDPANDTIFVKRCKAKLAKFSWEDALLDAQKVQ
ncbi:hypothetical protein AZE42_07146 [Rhizopogon vesiculosus]|uniref:Uncharacterized protein n=1 Tax=Rhizopogon vesiculosus TaxID=180088 RepID=A0A1J8PJR8_9AGAM|nr:hypothetical protein AZE42_07146 [Rhizopogon vesiculosus]